MSRIEELIKEKCSNGVEYKRLKDLCNFQRGQAITIKNLEEGDYPVIAGGQIPAFYCNKFNRNYECITISSSGAYAGFINYWNEKILCTDSFSIISNDKTILSNKFLFHFLKSKQEIVYQKKKGAGIPHVHISDVDIMRLPVPPIEVQEEIVRILDKFSELEAELENELEARKKQYEFWRDKLLNKQYDIKYLPELSVNLDNKRKPVTKSNRELGRIPYYGASGIVDYVSNYIFDDELLLISEDGANLKARSTPIAFSSSGKVWVNNHAHVLKFNSKITQKYVEHYLNMIDLTEYITGAAQPKLNQDNLNRIKINIPESIYEQEKIVTVLEKFDKLVNDISEGIPAEIEVRRKQYEYYRSKLLSFEELKDEKDFM